MEECSAVLLGNATDGGCYNLADNKYWPLIKEQYSIPGLEIAFVVFFFIVFITGIIANSLTLVVFCQLKAKLLWSNNNLLILFNLCVCDNVTIFLVAPFTLVLLLSDRVYSATLYEQDSDPGTVVVCNVIGVLFNYCSRAILLFLAVGAVDRFVAIFVPFKYKSIVTPAKIKGSLCFCHIISLIVTVAPFLAGARYSMDMNYAACHYNFEEVVKPQCSQGDCHEQLLLTPSTTVVTNPVSVGSAYFFLVFLVVIVPGLLMVASSLSVVYRLVSRLKEKRAESGSQKESGSLLKKSDGDTASSVTKQKVDPQEQAAVTISYLVLLYVICYLPWWILSFETFLEYTGALNYKTMLSGASEPFLHYFMLYLTIMTLVSSSLNPLIYFGRNRILMDKLEDVIKFRESIIKAPLRSTISAPVMSIPTF